MAVERNVTFEQLARRLNVSAADVAALDFRPALEVCARLIQNDTRDRFRKFQDPDGKPWKPLKHKPRIPRGRTKDQPLWATGRLVASTGAGADHVQEVGRSELVIGSSVSYAAYHQYGTKHIPARPFLGIGDELYRQLEDVLAKFVEDELAKAFEAP